MRCQLGRVQCSDDVDVDDAEIGLLRHGVGIEVHVEDFVGAVDAGVGDYVGDAAGRGDGGGCLEETELVGPGGCVAGDEFGSGL